jgi:hypothetical protein
MLGQGRISGSSHRFENNWKRSDLILLCHEDASRTSFAFERDGGQETEVAAVSAGPCGHVQRSSGMPTDMPLTADKALLSYSLKKEGS